MSFINKERKKEGQNFQKRERERERGFEYKANKNRVMYFIKKSLKSIANKFKPLFDNQNWEIFVREK